MKPARLILARLLARPLPPVISAHFSQILYPQALGWQHDHSFRAPVRTGSVYAGTTRDMHSHMVAIHGYFDWRLVATAAFLCRPGDRVVEVGANVGTETLALADIVGPTGHVHAFEPVPANADQMCSALSEAGIAHVEVERAAVSDASGEVSFTPSDNELESGSGHLSTDGNARTTGQLTVKCITLDDYLSGKSAMSLLVIDAEGAEVQILRGAREVLRRDMPAVIVEAQERALRQFGVGLADLHAELLEHGYEVFELSRLGLSRAQANDTRRTRNWVALPLNRLNEAKGLHRHLMCCGLLPGIPGLNPLTKRYS